MAGRNVGLGNGLFEVVHAVIGLRVLSRKSAYISARACTHKIIAGNVCLIPPIADMRESA
jgi:hypothetical protein